MASYQAIPFEKPSRSSQVAETLAERITKGEWSVGSWMPPTRDLAQRFGVSRKTVQGALGLLEKRKLIGRRHRQGCFVQSAPGKTSAPATQKAQVGIICTGGHTPVLLPPPQDPTRDWGWAIINGAQEDMARAGKLMTLIPRHLFDKDPLAALLERVDLIRETLSGIICFPTILPTKLAWGLLKALDERQIPYVTINRLSDLSHHNFVSADFIGGTRLIGRCLARMGMRRVVLLETAAVADSHSELERIGGLFQGYAIDDVPTREITLLRCTNNRAESGYEQVQRYLDENPAPQAVVAMGDFLAQGAANALTKRGLRIPEDVGVIGGTGLPQAHEMTPTLTTLTQPMAELGRQAMQMLLEMERADITRMTGRTVRGELVIRQSMPIPESIQRELAEESETWSFKTEE